MADWPATLPQAPLLSGYQESFPDVRLRTSMDTGPAKMRRRFTAAVVPISINLILTDAQLDTFEEFYNTTLSGGALAFDWTHPRTAAEVSMRVVSVPSFTPLGNGKWSVPLSVEVMP